MTSTRHDDDIKTPDGTPSEHWTVCYEHGLGEPPTLRRHSVAGESAGILPAALTESDATELRIVDADGQIVGWAVTPARYDELDGAARRDRERHEETSYGGYLPYCDPPFGGDGVHVPDEPVAGHLAFAIASVLANPDGWEGGKGRQWRKPTPEEVDAVRDKYRDFIMGSAVIITGSVPVPPDGFGDVPIPGWVRQAQGADEVDTRVWLVGKPAPDGRGLFTHSGGSNVFGDQLWVVACPAFRLVTTISEESARQVAVAIGEALPGIRWEEFHRTSDLPEYALNVIRDLVREEFRNVIA